MTIKKEIGIDKQSGRFFVELTDLDVRAYGDEILLSRSYYNTESAAKAAYNHEKVYDESLIRSTSKKFKRQ